jgi:hypothetical protein
MADSYFWLQYVFVSFAQINTNGPLSQNQVASEIKWPPDTILQAFQAPIQYEYAEADCQKMIFSSI